MPFLAQGGRAKASDVVAHIEHALKMCGEDHVAIGTDGPVTQNDDLELFRQALHVENEQRRAAGVNTPGEDGDDIYTFVVDLRGPTQFHHLADLLAARGHSETVIDKILGRNLLRLYKDVWGA